MRLDQRTLGESMGWPELRDADAARALRNLLIDDALRAVILVEGVSDRVALSTLAARLERDLDDEGVAIVPMGGATAARRFVELFGPHGLGVGLAGLCDAREAPGVRRALARGRAGALDAAASMNDAGLFVCDPDLEAELIRSLGADAVVRCLELHGDLRSFEIVRQQPAQLGRAVEDVLQRFLGTRSGRKEFYAEALVQALSLDAAPRPLVDVLDAV